MTGIELLKILQSMSEKEISEEIIIATSEQQFWIDKIEVSTTGESGYEIGGEIRIIVE